VMDGETGSGYEGLGASSFSFGPLGHRSERSPGLCLHPRRDGPRQGEQLGAALTAAVPDADQLHASLSRFGFKAPAIASTSCAQRECSASSCFFPAAVRRYTLTR